jgi:hypothetical protein
MKAWIAAALSVLLALQSGGFGAVATWKPLVGGRLGVDINGTQVIFDRDAIGGSVEAGGTRRRLQRRMAAGRFER